MPGRTYTDEQRAEALEVYREHGPNEASRRLGIPANTITNWAHKAGFGGDTSQTAAAIETKKLRWAERRATLADEIGLALPELLAKAKAAEKGSDASGFATALGILVDKAQLLIGAATSRHEVLDAERRKERIAEIADDLAQRREKRAG